MDNKAWLWRKKSSEKTIFAADNVNLSSKGNEEEIQILLSDKAGLEKDLKILNDKLTSALSQSNAKDELAKKHTKIAQEAIANLEKAEAESISLKQELDEALHQIVIGEERLAHLDAALKECMQHLRFVRDDQEQRIHDAMMKTSKEFEKSKKVLEDNLAETTKRLSKIGVENSNLSKALLVKEQMIENSNKQKTQVEADLNALMARLEATERENASLRYEVRVLEKDLEIRNEEREFNRRAADATHKQHLENVKKIAKLESECQRLRVLVRKRLPGPAALAKMKHEVDLMGNDSMEMRRRRLSLSPTGSPLSSIADNASEQLFALEEENRTLKEALNRKANELQLSHIRHARTTSKLSQVESQLQESSKGQAAIEPVRSLVSQEPSLASVSDIGSDDKVSCSESWASALISELENFRSDKQKGLSSSKTVGASDMNLMDDFLEMEKLAIVSADTNNSNMGEIADASKSSILSNTSDPPQANGYNSIIPLDKTLSIDSCGVLTDVEMSLTEKSNYQSRSDLSKSICKIIELIDGISLPSQEYDNPPSLSRKDGTAPTGYIVRAFQWKVSEVAAVLHQFVQTCHDLLNGKADLNKFSQETASALDWIINHCFSVQDVSSMRDEIKKQFDWDETRSENEAEAGVFSQFSEADKLRVARDQSWLPSNGHNDLFQLEQQSNMTEENRKLKDELLNTASSKKELERRLESAISKSESLLNQLKDSEQKIASLEAELESSKISRGNVEEQIENQKSANNDLEAQLIAAKSEITEAYQNLTSLEAELENKSSSYEELEATCVELQLQLESMTKKETLNFDLYEEAKPLQTGWEISAATEKLAECQETILNLGKQLKALAPSKEAALFDKVICTPTESANTNTTTTTTTSMTPALPKGKMLNRHSSLLDRMIAEDGEATEHPKKSTFPNATENPDGETAVESWAIVPSKKQGSASLWRKLLWRRKRGNVKKAPLPFPSR